MAGLSERGLEIRTQPEIRALLEEAVLASFPQANVRAGPIQQVIGVMSEQLAIAWETIQALYAASHPETAQGLFLDQLAALTGTSRPAATRSHVTALVTLNAGVTLAAGAIAAVAGNADAQFRTVAPVANAGGSPASAEVEVEALELGPVAAPTGTLTVIVTPRPGWTAITNAADATPGRALATDEELRATRIVELAGAGASTLPALGAAVSRVEGVLSVTVYENVTLGTVSGRPGKSFEVVVWDGSPPPDNDDAIAQAIFDHKPLGIECFSDDGSSGTALAPNGGTIEVDFTRAAVVGVHVAATVILEPGTGAGWVDAAKAAIVARGAQYVVGETGYVSQIIEALHDVAGIRAVTVCTIGTSGPPAGSSVAAAYDEILRIDTADVEVGT